MNLDAPQITRREFRIISVELWALGGLAWMVTTAALRVVFDLGVGLSVGIGMMVFFALTIPVDRIGRRNRGVDTSLARHLSAKAAGAIFFVVAWMLIEQLRR